MAQPGIRGAHPGRGGLPVSAQHPDPERWWRWRRRYAHVALAAALAETAYLLGAGVPGSAAPVVAWSYGLWGSIVCAYIGAATWADVASKR